MDIAKFAEWVIEYGPFSGNDIDGGAVQEKAAEFGILVETNYDPTIHGTATICDVEPGDAWYVFSDEFKAALTKG